MSWNEIERLEENWVSPQNEKFATSWQPLPGLKPYEGNPPVLEDTFSNVTNDERLLSDECLSMGRAIWNGTPDSSGHFHCYPIPTSGNAAWKEWHRHENCPPGKDFWWCSNVKSAADHYSWKHFSGGSFEQLALALQRAMIAGDDLNAAVVCLKILAWGGVRRANSKTETWLMHAAAKKTLIGDLKKATRSLRANSNDSLGIFGSHKGGIPMNSGTTKIFAAVGVDFTLGLNDPRQDVLILDGRVGAAMGLIAKMIAGCSVPSHFIFPWSPARGTQNRDPSCACIRFPNMSAAGYSDKTRAEFTRRGAKVIQEIIGKTGPSTEFIEAEKGLFMIGYDLSNTCAVFCSTPRLCPHCMHVNAKNLPVSARSVKKALPAGGVKKKSSDKKDKAKAIFIEEKSRGLVRGHVIERFINEAGLTKNGASTYYTNFNNGKWADQVG